MRSLYLWGRSIQEMDGDVVIGHSIYAWGGCNRWVIMLPILQY